jgi:hypothetical protein
MSCSFTGAIVALTKLGPHTIHNLVLPNLKDYVATLEDTMTELAPDASPEERVRRLEATKCYSALLVSPMTHCLLARAQQWRLDCPSSCCGFLSLRSRAATAICFNA